MHAKQSHKLYFLSILIITFTLFSPIILTAIENAGVLPYTIQNNKVYLLLGNDTHRGEFGWGDFGGGAKDKKNPKKSAAIEGHEETMGRFSRNLTDPEPEKYETEGIKYFTDFCLDDNKVESTDYCFYFVQVPYIPSADLMKTRATLKARRAAPHYLEKDDFAWVEGQNFLDTILDTIKAGITDKTAITHIKKKISLDDAFVIGKKVEYLSKYFIHSMVQPKAIEILKRLISGDATVKLQQSLTSLKEKLAKLAGVLMTVSQKKFSPTEAEIKKAAAATGVSEDNVRDYVNKNFLGDEPKNYEEFENNLKSYAPKKSSDLYLTLLEGDIVKQKFTDPKTSAITNAANSSLIGLAGIAPIIQKAGGKTLEAELKSVGGCPEGQARITFSHNMSKRTDDTRVDWVINAVGPQSIDPDALRSVYQFCLKIADDPNKKDEAGKKYLYKTNDPTFDKNIPRLTAVAIPAISTGIFGYTIDLATPVALNGVLDYLYDNQKTTSVREVRFVTYKQYSDRVGSFPEDYWYYVDVLRGLVKDGRIKPATDADAKILVSLKTVDALNKLSDKGKAKTKKPLRFIFVK